MRNNTTVKLAPLVSPLISILVAFLVSAFFVLWAKELPIHHYFVALQQLVSIIFGQTFGSGQKFMDVLVYATPLLFCGLAHIICFRCNMFNIGAEGQFMMGMIFAALVGLLPNVNPVVHVALIVLAGILGGSLWAAVPGILKAKRGINEVVICIMTNFVAMHLLNYIALRSTFADSSATATYALQSSAQLFRFTEGSRLNIGLIFAVLTAVAVYLFLYHSKRGFQIRTVGFNPSAAQAGGINTTFNMVLALVLSGAIAGVGGAVHVAGVQHRLLSVSSFPGYGMDAIAIALLCNKNPLGCMLVAILFGALRNSAGMFQVEGIPKDVVYLIQAIIIFFVAADFVSKYIQTRRASK